MDIHILYVIHHNKSIFEHQLDDDQISNVAESLTCQPEHNLDKLEQHWVTWRFKYYHCKDSRHLPERLTTTTTTTTS